ncbi:gliding motility-associated C-terminal domain-containing protein [Flavobacterium sp. MAH-1]|uniref:Gliding motility-associated C-terminal domain-containing protein n=1 Tax=Flavobacterium agri TaxID=2743471 RepID=A0A7Y9C3N9_9FLAO|nr:gliding motility-associated C-terminal domain-containing protein [Flavobacterium agri]NUY79277.1 gliding motility-associated C-terminal domain-containing protein [Flavobacterium agri]NYA69301.1 gliding motility-associated C-terminal domain-containing protein [Flavobacterium agri]
MNWKNTYTRLLLIFGLFASFSSQSQCIQIESILVDACGTQEGLNEMVRFKVGNANLNTSNLSVDWPNNNWQGLLQNTVTASKTAALNADILDAGGCGQLLEPTNGLLPANANVILVTSFNLDTPLNQFGAITEDFYILYQNNTTVTGGHFANSGTGTRTLSISFGSCTDTVTYDRALLVNQSGATVPADGATVLFANNGTPTYINNGCSAPVPPFTIHAGNNITACAGSTVNLNAQSQGAQSTQWSATQGSFSNTASLTSNYTLPLQANGTITLTLTATNACGATISDTVTITVSTSVTPNFQTSLSLCNGQAAPNLANVSPNGISGSWNPSTINNTQSGNYVFTPNAGQCANPVTLSVTVSNGGIVPNFATQLSVCAGSTPPVLATTSPNGISGTWNPSVINTNTSGSYVFTPNVGQCAVPVTLSVTVSNGIIPNFATQLTVCSGTTPPVLATTSPNGISGTWNPSTINTNTNATYIFTPNSGQCAQNATLTVNVVSQIVPDFETNLTICASSTIPVLATTSPNGISGSWNPSVINASQSDSYIFTPNAGQCATSVTLTVTVTTPIIPDFETQFTLCNGSPAPILQTVSPNGITGSWTPSVISSTQNATYTFTPDTGQCAQTASLSVSITTLDVAISQGCENGSYMLHANQENQFDSFEWTLQNGPVVGNSAELNVSGLTQTMTIDFPATFQLSVSTNDGCNGTAPVTVNGILCSIPKGISPNGDSFNDSFDLTGFGVSELKIYNRYGTEVYNRKNYTDQWHGQSDNGNDLPDATYYYAITTVGGNVKTGWVYVVRKS